MHTITQEQFVTAIQDSMFRTMMLDSKDFMQLFIGTKHIETAYQVDTTEFEYVHCFQYNTGKTKYYASK